MHITRRTALLCSSLALAACQDPGEMPPPPAPETGLPCDVEQVLADNCQSCHAAEPRYGAPMPLMTWEDVQAASVTDPTQTVAERMLVRVADGSMPPSGELSPDELETLTHWLGHSAPRAGAGEGCGAGGDAGVPPPPPTPASCDGTLHEFLAYGESDPGAAYHVPQEPGDYYVCFAFPSPFAAGDLADRFDVSVGDERVIHHLILYSTPSRPEQDVFRCERMPEDISFVTGWAPGGDAIEMPPGVGAEVPGPDQWLILQAHYHNDRGLDDAFDQSGLSACVTDEPMGETAAVVTLGNTAFEIPARTEGHAISGDCEVPSMAPTLHVLGTAPHMHETGRALTTEIRRAAGEVDVLTHVEPWDFANQGYYPLESEVLVEPGDVLRTTCVYDNPGDSVVRSGERTEDEMCLNFLWVYPAPPADYRRCVRSGG